MTDRPYQLADIIIDKNIDESFKCGICMDILRSPILCGGGHSWCYDCIRSHNQQKCPICPRSIDYKDPVPNFSLKSVIEKMPCRCPHNNINIDNNKYNISKKRKNYDNDSSHENNLEFCNWIGKYEQLEHHLKKNCAFVPFPCAFSVHGCEFIGNKRLLDDHYNNNSHLHNLMLSNKIMSLESSMKLDQVVITQLKQRVVNSEEGLRRAKRKIEILKDATVVRITWNIANVYEKVCDKASVLSDSFLVAAPNGDRYKMHLKARFGRTAENSIGLFLLHHESETFSNELPISISGTRFTIKHSLDLNMDIIETMTCNNRLNDCTCCVIDRSDASKGKVTLCEDLFLDETLLKDDSIDIVAEVRINYIESEFYNP